MQKVKAAWYSFKDYIIKHKIISLLLFTVLGGIPGMINIWNWTHNKADFDFYFQQELHGRENLTGQTVFFLDGAVYNDGGEPLFPVLFNVDMTFNNGSTLKATATALRDSFYTGKGAQLQNEQRLVFSKGFDLTQTVRVNPKDAVWGRLAFFTADITNEDASSGVREMYITCMDIRQKFYRIKIDLSHAMDGIIPFSPKTGSDVK